MFQADCRGVGTDWSPAQLRQIADALLGTTQLVASAGEALGGGLPERRWRRRWRKSVAAGSGCGLWMPKNARLVAVKQAFPTEIDLTSKVVPVDQRAVDIPLGAWGSGDAGLLRDSSR